jgi:hypothetical protein
MANGLDQIYTPEHKGFFNKIEEEGGFISEFTTEEKFDRKHFLIRSQKVQLITGVEDLVKGMGWESAPVSSGVQKTCSLNLMKRESHF